MKRPYIKEYFGENATLEQVHKTYLENPELFKYAQALDSYIDYLIDKIASVLELDKEQLK